MRRGETNMEIQIDIGDDFEQEEISMRSLMKAVCHQLDTDLVEMRSSRRTQDISYKRHVFYYLAQKYSFASYPKIAKFANRDHTSVMHGIKKVKSLYVGDKSFENLVNAIVESARLIDGVENIAVTEEIMERQRRKIEREKEELRKMREKEDRHKRLLSESEGRFRIAIIDGKPMCVPQTARVENE
jgi:predicted transcriptional regulator with HTH domain